MRIWHWIVVVLLTAVVLAAGRDPFLWIPLLVGASALGVAATLACGLSLGRLARVGTRRADLLSCLLCVGIVLLPLLTLVLVLLFVAISTFSGHLFPP